jgi:exodeoxyribonuclease-3
MILVSFNINGLRARLHQIEALKSLNPDVIGLQEIKVDDSQYPHNALTELGFMSDSHGQKGHYGVANLTTRAKPTEVIRGFPTDEGEVQKRIIASRFETNLGRPLTVINGYFPQGEGRAHPEKFPAKEKFYADLSKWMERSFTPDDLVAIIGDFNIAPVDQDIGIGEKNAKRWLKTGKSAFLPEEREWFQRLEKWGLQDAYRTLNPEVNDRFSWFDYRSRGFEDDPKRGLKIDHIMITEPLRERLQRSDISYDIRGMEKPSDHAPIWAQFDLELV